MQEQKKKNPWKRVTATRGMGQVITVTIGLVVLLVVFHFMSDKFLTRQNVSNLLRQIVPYLIVGIGQSYVLITGNIDLSIGSVVGMSTMVSATMMSRGINAWVAIGFTLVCCLTIGIINGVLVAFFKLPPFIATLGTMTIGRGIAQIANNGRNTDAIGQTGAAFKEFFYSGNIKFAENSTKGAFTIYYGVILAIVLWAIFNFILSRTRTGRHIYAIGSNVEASKLSGVSVVSTTVKAYLVSAFCACFVGFVTTATTGMGAMDAGNSYEMYAVAASVIGGVSTLGGQGILLGTVVGASIWAVLQNGLSIGNAPVAIRNILIGIIVVVSVMLDVLLRRGNPRRNRAPKEVAPVKPGGENSGS